MKKITEIAELLLKLLSCFAIVVGGAWAYVQFNWSGAKDWQANISIRTQVLPYRGDLKLLVVNITSKNPRPVEFRIDKPRGAFDLRLKKIAVNLQSGDIILPDNGELFAEVDLLNDGGYVLLPNAEIEEMAAFVVPTDSSFLIAAEMKVALKDTKKAADDYEYVSAYTTVSITPAK